MKSLTRLHIVLLISILTFSGCSSFHKGVANREAESAEFMSVFMKAQEEKTSGNYKLAQELFQQCLRINKKSAIAYYELSGILAYQKEYQLAYEYSSRAYELEPSNVWYGLQKAKMAYGMAKYDDYIATLKKLVKDHPDKFDLKLKMADAYIQLQQSGDAIDVLNDIEKEKGPSEAIYKQRYQLYMQLGDIERAENELLKLNELHPESVDNLRYLAEYYQEVQKPNKALEIYRKILEVDPNDANTNFELYEFYHVEGNVEKAFYHLKKAFASEALNIDRKVKLIFSYYDASAEDEALKANVYELLDLMVDAHSNDAKAFSVYGDFLYRDKRLAEARQNFLKALQLVPNKYLIWRQVVLIDYERKVYSNMFEDAQEATSYFPSQPELYWFQGLAAMRLGNHDEAVVALENGVSLVIDNFKLQAQFYALLGESYQELKQFDKSDTFFDRAIELDSENPGVFNNYAYYLSLRKRRLRKAKSLSKKSLEMEPDNVSYLDTYGWILFQLEEFTESEIYIEKAFTKGGEKNPVILEHLGDVKAKLGKTEEAVKYWHMAIDQGGHKDYILEKISRKAYFEENE